MRCERKEKGPQAEEQTAMGRRPLRLEKEAMMAADVDGRLRRNEDKSVPVRVYGQSKE